MLIKPKRLGYLVNSMKPDFISEPEFIEIPKFNIVGLEGVTTLENERIGNSVVPKLWCELLKRRKEIFSRLNNKTFMGISTSDMMCENYINYIACCKVESICNIPKGMIAKTIPKSKYAKFNHSGSEKQSYDSFDYIFGAWLINSGYELANDIDIIFIADEAHKKHEFLIPIK